MYLTCSKWLFSNQTVFVVPYPGALQDRLDCAKRRLWKPAFGDKVLSLRKEHVHRMVDRLQFERLDVPVVNVVRDSAKCSFSLFLGFVQNLKTGVVPIKTHCCQQFKKEKRNVDFWNCGEGLERRFPSSVNVGVQGWHQLRKSFLENMIYAFCDGFRTKMWTFKALFLGLENAKMHKI